MASKIIVRGHKTGSEALGVTAHGVTAHGVYDDRFFCIFQALSAATPTVMRATEVEFDHQCSEWVATHLASREVIARGTNRSEVIRHEVEWLEQKEII